MLKLFALPFLLLITGVNAHSHEGYKKPLAMIKNKIQHPHPPRVIVTIKPIHSLIAALMDGVGEVELLIQGNTSPHTHALKPSEARTLEKADIIVWIGEIYETGLKNRLNNLEKSKFIINLSKTKHMNLYPVRQGGRWGTHPCSHPCEGLSEEKSSCDNPSHTKDPFHESLSKDGHLWLDPNNAKAIVTEVTQTLTTLDPQHAPNYLANSQKVIKRLDDLENEIREILGSAKNTPYMMVHDFSQYFDRYFGTQGVGTIMDTSHTTPTPRHLRQVRHKLKDGQTKCLIVEPQFNLKAVTTLVEDTGIPTREVDYLGADLDKGPDCYFEIMRRFAKSLVQCSG